MWRVWEGKECFERNTLLLLLHTVFVLRFVAVVDFLVVVVVDFLEVANLLVK